MKGVSSFVCSALPFFSGSKNDAVNDAAARSIELVACNALHRYQPLNVCPIDSKIGSLSFDGSNFEQARVHRRLFIQSGWRTTCGTDSVGIRANVMYRRYMSDRLLSLLLTVVPIKNMRAERFLFAKGSEIPVIVRVLDGKREAVAIGGGKTNAFGELNMQVELPKGVEPGVYSAELLSEEMGGGCGVLGAVSVNVLPESLDADQNEVSQPLALITDMDNTLFPTRTFDVKCNPDWPFRDSFSNIFVMRDGINRLPTEYQFFPGMKELLHLTEQHGFVLTISASPISLLEDLDATFKYNNIKSEGGVELKHWCAHKKNLYEQFSYKTKMLLRNMEHWPVGTPIVFVGDDKEYDAEIYLTIKKLMLNEITPEQLADTVCERTDRSFVGYDKALLIDMAQAVQDKQHKFSDIVIRKMNPGISKLDSETQEQVLYVVDGFDAALRLTSQGRFPVNHFIQYVVTPMLESGMSKESLLSSLREHREVGTINIDVAKKVVEAVEHLP